MAAFMDFTPEQKAEFERWVAERPPDVQEMVKSHPPNLLYRNTVTNQRVCIVSYSEDGTVTVAVTGKFNRCMYERNVFGVPLNELEECDLPGPDEELGAMLTEQKDVDAFINAVRPHVLKQRGLQ